MGVVEMPPSQGKYSKFILNFLLEERPAVAEDLRDGVPNPPKVIQKRET